MKLNVARTLFIACGLLWLSPLFADDVGEHSIPNDTSDSEITLSLHQADIQDLVRWVSSVTHKTIIIHPAVQGKVTVIAGDPMTENEAYRLFLSVLQVHDFMVVETDGALKVVPSKLGKEETIPLQGDGARNNDDMVIRIFKIVNVSATEVQNLVGPMLPQEALLAVYQETNSLLIAARSGKVIQIASIIAQLDKAGTIDIELIPIQYASARDVASTLRELLPSMSSQKNQPNGFSFAVDERSNSILLTGDALTRQQVNGLIKRLDTPLPGDGNTQVIFLEYARAADLVPVLESVGGSIARGEKDQRLSHADISIRADEALNSLIITAPPAVLSTIKGVINKLDVRRAQVLVEALIVEVNEDFSRDLGIEWRTNLEQTGDSVFIGSNTFSNAVAPFSVDTDGSVTLGRGLSVGYFTGADLRAILRALEGTSDANILSTPTIMAMDNEPARILVGSNVPFVTGSQMRQGSTDPFQTIQRQDIGVVLKIKPHINNSDSVTLEIEQTVESIAQTDATTADIVTYKREISTRALIDNDQVLVLGGLIRDEVVQSETRVPLLGSIPLIGRAFRSSSNKVIKQNLMVFIHPVILRDTQSSYEVTRNRYRYMQDNQREFRSRMDNFLIPRDPALLDDMSAPTTDKDRDNKP